MKKRFALIQITGLALLSGTIFFSYDNASNLDNEKEKATGDNSSVAFFTSLEDYKNMKKELIVQSVAHDHEIEIARIEAEKIQTEKLQAEKKKQEVQSASVKRKEVTLTDRSEASRLKVTATAYTSCDFGMQCTGVTATGKKVRKGHIAVDPKVIPLHSKVRIISEDYPEINGIYYAEDTGSAIKGKKIDIYFNNKKEALQFGRRKVEIAILEE